MKLLLNSIRITVVISVLTLYANTPSIFDKPEKKDPVKILQNAQRDYSHIKNMYDQAQNAYKESISSLDGLHDRLRSEKCSIEFVELKKQKGLCVKTGKGGACIGASLAHQKFEECIQEGIKEAQIHKEECESKINMLKEQLFEISQHLTKARHEAYASRSNDTTLKDLPPASINTLPIIQLPSNNPPPLHDASSYIHQHVTNPIITLSTTDDRNENDTQAETEVEM
jgi:hypothetical protein